MATWCHDIEGGTELRVKVVPGASRDRIAGVLGDALKVQVSAAPERGRANTAVELLLAATLGIASSAVRVTAGLAQPHKTITIAGLTAADVLGRLNVK